MKVADLLPGDVVTLVGEAPSFRFDGWDEDGEARATIPLGRGRVLRTAFTNLPERFAFVVVSVTRNGVRIHPEGGEG